MPGGQALIWDTGTWDDDVWDVGAAIDSGVYTTPGYCPDYLRFQLSGINLGLYTFEINPSNYNIFPQKRTGGYATILDPDPTVEEDFNKLEIQVSWKRMPLKMWEQIEAYSRKEVDGTSEDMWFWDANTGRFTGNKVKVEKLSARVRGGTEPLDRFDVKMSLKEL